MKNDLATAIRYGIIAWGGSWVGQGLLTADQLQTLAGGTGIAVTAIYYYLLKPRLAKLFGRVPA